MLDALQLQPQRLTSGRSLHGEELSSVFKKLLQIDFRIQARLIPGVDLGKTQDAV